MNPLSSISNSPLHLPALAPAKAPPKSTAPAPPQDQVEITSTVAEPPAPKLRQPTGEMAEMMENIQAAEERSQRVGNDLEKAVLADLRLERSLAHGPLVVLEEAPVAPAESKLDSWVADLHAQGEHPKAKEHHGLLGGHLGLEGGEHVAHGLAHAKHEGLHQAHDLAQTKVEALHHAQEAASLKATAASESSGEVVNLAVTGGQQAGHALSGWLTALTGTLAAGSGVLGVVLLKTGIQGAREGIRHKDSLHTIEGVNTAVVGTRSLAAATTMTGHLFHGSEILTAAAGIAKSTLTPLGVFHGAVDAGIGVKQVYDGVKAGDTGKITKGGLGVGLGVSLVAAAVGGGIPALVGAGIFLTGKVVHGLHQRRAAQQSSGESS